MVDQESAVDGAGAQLPSAAAHKRPAASPHMELEVGRAREVALRLNIRGVLARPGSARAMLQGCADALVQHLDAAFARIWTLRPGTSVLELQASAGIYTRIDGRYARVTVGALKIGQIAHERRPYLTNDVLTDPRIVDKAWAAREGMVSFAGYPLIVEDRVVGVMALFARAALDAASLEALAAVADAVAQGIERKRSEDQLRRSEAYLAEGQRLSRTGSWAWKFATREGFWSREMFRISGFEPSESPPSIRDVVRRTHPDDRARVIRTLNEAFRNATDFRLQSRVCIPGRSVTWVESHGHPVRDESGVVVEFIGTVVDITERRRAARRLRRAIEARYDAVLEERTRIARDFHDGVLQDLTALALLLEATIPRVHDHPEDVTTGLRSMLALVDRTRKDGRRAVIGLRHAEPAAQLVGSVHRAAQRACQESGVLLSMQQRGIERQLEPESIDALSYVVHEAVTNAVRHGAASKVRVLVSFGARSLQIAVRDNGTGFRRPSDTDDGAGHFGLVGMRERAAALGGTLTIASAPRRGALVRVSLKLEPR